VPVFNKTIIYYLPLMGMDQKVNWQKK